MRFNHDLERYVQYDFLLGIPAVYLIVIYSLRLIMKNRPACENLKLPMTIYNWTQVVVSGVMTYELGRYVGFPNVFALNTDFTAHCEFWMFIHYLSKILDMADTVFIVLRKKDKQLSFLHVYHHASIGMIWGFLLLFGYGGGTGFYGAFINSLVHTVMYFHYSWVALGFNNPYKKYVTTLQISQFYSCMLHATFGAIWDVYFPTRVCMLQLAYQTSMIMLFTGFFKETYKRTRVVVDNLPAADITTLDVSKASDLKHRKNEDAADKDCIWVPGRG
ncbi:Elongation of very long chain fatty acids protein [Diplonema papillatum]|nr:Elongation of very long chain fatty acids protein [Diplonema papillatum]